MTSRCCTRCLLGWCPHHATRKLGFPVVRHTHSLFVYQCLLNLCIHTMLLSCLSRSANALPARNTIPRLLSAAYSTQFEEAVHVTHPSKSQTVESPPITPDSSTGHGDHISDGRSSQTTSAYVAEEPMRQLVHKVLSIYEVRSLEEQRSLFTELYDKDAIYENNVTLLHGRDEIIKRFALLPLSTHRVQLEYEKPVVLGATTSAPEALNDLAFKGDLQVEVKNTQHYSFDRGHSVWRRLLLPHGDLQLSVLTRLTLSHNHKVLYHRDIWTQHSNTWWQPLQRCWGVMEQAAGSQATSQAGART